MSIKELREKAFKMNITLTGEERAKDIEALIKAKKAEEKDASGSNDNAKNVEGMKYVWVKDRAYVTDEKRVDAGLYLIAEVPTRFSKMGNAVEVFEGEIPSRKLGDIAKWAGIKDTREMSDKVLLEKLLSTYKTF